jgi:hypothetical protein
MDLQFYYLSLLSVFAVVLYMMAVDPNVSKFIVLLAKMGRVNISRGIFWLKFYPRLRFDTFVLKWRSRQIVKKLLKERERE